MTSDETPQPKPSPWRAAAASLDRVVAPLAIFVAIYFGTFLLTAGRLLSFYFESLVSAVVATAATIWLWDRGRWNLGIAAPARRVVPETLAGGALAVTLIGTGDLLIIASTGLSHARGNGFPLAETFAVYLPAAVYEELLFRGYPFQRLWQWRRGVAVVSMSALFAALHGGNAGITALALINVFLGGVLLSLAYALWERLWFPTALHLGWNLMSGPVLGYEISGYTPETSLLRVEGNGPELLTGGAFGIEGSVWLTAVEIVAIAFLWMRRPRGEKVER
jgi:membrane protease YdiL (CAAX protease family)